jgi:hypothetical protein
MNVGNYRTKKLNTNKEVLDVGFWFGIVFMAIVTFGMNWFIYSEVKEQRDYWKVMYCTQLEPKSVHCG